MAKLTIVLDTRRALTKSNNFTQEDCYPLKLSVFIAEKGKFMLNTGVAIPKENWINNSIKGLPAKDIYNNVLRTRLNAADNELLRLDISGELASLSISEIKDRITSIIKRKVADPSNTVKQTIEVYFRAFIDQKERQGTKAVYAQTLAKIGHYYDTSNLTFEAITISWLREFEQKMRTDGLSINTISVHMRCLRAIFNDAIDQNKIGQNIYPFRKFKIKSEKTIKRSLTIEQLRTLRDYHCQDHQLKYRDLFMLIFFLEGINLVDLLNLKHINENRIEFRRAKTGRLYSIKVEPEAMAIIDRYRGKEYLLDVLDNYGNHKDFLHRLNKNLQTIGHVELVANAAKDPQFVKKNKKQVTPILPNLTTYWARHTWATIAAGLEIPKETIAAALGHGGDSVTDIYIDFDRAKVDTANRAVIDAIR